MEHKLNVLLINGSPNAIGCTYTALSEVERTLQAEGIATELVHIGNRDIRGCIACYRCAEQGHCVFNDAVNELAPKFEAADGLVVGSPTYYAGPNGTLTNLLDRLFFSTPFSKRMKVGAAVCSARRGGTTATFDRLNKYFTISEMPVASSRYWNMVHGHNAEDVLKDEEGIQCMRILGRNMAFLLRAIAAERERNGLPMQEETVYTNFIR
jgi:multimeric flavodoxin WrbA